MKFMLRWQKIGQIKQSFELKNTYGCNKWRGVQRKIYSCIHLGNVMEINITMTTTRLNHKINYDNAQTIDWGNYWQRRILES